MMEVPKRVVEWRWLLAGGGMVLLALFVLLITAVGWRIHDRDIRRLAEQEIAISTLQSRLDARATAEATAKVQTCVNARRVAPVIPAITVLLDNQIEANKKLLQEGDHAHLRKQALGRLRPARSAWVTYVANTPIPKRGSCVKLARELGVDFKAITNPRSEESR